MLFSHSLLGSFYLLISNLAASPGLAIDELSPGSETPGTAGVRLLTFQVSHCFPGFPQNGFPGFPGAGLPWPGRLTSHRKCWNGNYKPGGSSLVLLAIIPSGRFPGFLLGFLLGIWDSMDSSHEIPVVPVPWVPYKLELTRNPAASPELTRAGGFTC